MHWRTKVDGASSSVGMRKRALRHLTKLKASSTLLLAMLLTALTNGAHVVNNVGRKINGVRISALEDGSVTLVTASGQKMTFRKGQYREAFADRPNELAQAEALLKQGDGGKAVPLLQKVKAGYRFLGWDGRAIRLLADHYYESGQFKEAALEYGLLEALDDPAIQARHREALVKSGDLEQVLPVINADIAGGSREAAARAYLLRGELKAANGDMEGARRDWMKVATLFKAQRELAEQAEEHLKE